jgi:hypothetical protein
MTGLKATFNRSTKAYEVQVLANADPIACFSGWVVFDCIPSTLHAVNNGRMIQSFSVAKRAAITNWLFARMDELVTAKLASLGFSVDHLEYVRDCVLECEFGFDANQRLEDSEYIAELVGEAVACG